LWSKGFPILPDDDTQCAGRGEEKLREGKKGGKFSEKNRARRLLHPPLAGALQLGETDKQLGNKGKRTKKRGENVELRLIDLWRHSTSAASCRRCSRLVKTTRRKRGRAVL